MKIFGQIELCGKEDVAGRASITMTALKISKDYSDNNDNGINWDETYVKDNLDSFIGGAFKVDFVDEDKTYPSGHGELIYDDDGNATFPTTDTVGTILSAEIQEKEINDELCKVLVVSGYIHKQSYPNFYNWLKEESNLTTVFGSVEINGKNSAKEIIYDGDSKDSNGNLIIGRKPKVFDFVSLAILSSFVPPADKFSQIIEVNSMVNKLKQVEINELSAEDICCLLSKYFNINYVEKFNEENSWDYYIYKWFPESKRAIFKNYCKTPNEFIMVDYSISDDKISFNNIIKVEETYVPTTNEKVIEINSSKIKTKVKGVKSMEENKVIIELNQKLEANAVEINKLSTEKDEISTKNVELSETIVNANKTVEELNSKIETLTNELSACKTDLEKMQAEKTQAEVNSYFETIKSENGFSEPELNSLKEEYVDKCDLVGLKSKEIEICANKFKSMTKKTVEIPEGTNVEVNSLFFSTKVEVEANSTDDGADLFK